MMSGAFGRVGKDDAQYSEEMGLPLVLGLEFHPMLVLDALLWPAIPPSPTSGEGITFLRELTLAAFLKIVSFLRQVYKLGGNSELWMLL